MYSRNLNGGNSVHGGGVEVLPAPRAALPPAPVMPHHRVYAHHRRSPPPSHIPYYSASSGQLEGRPPHNQHEVRHATGYPVPSTAYDPSRQAYVHGQEYVHDPRYPAPYYQHHFTAEVPAMHPHPHGRHSYGGEPLYGGRTGGAPLYEQPVLADYRPSVRPAVPYMADGMVMRASQQFYEKSGDQCPTYIGYIKSAQDAILLLSACDLSAKSPSSPSSSASAIPPPRRVTRRLLDAERAEMVASGCIFAWDEKEAGMKRWTDGRVWSASRVSGCFLTYRELEARKKSNGNALDGPTSNQYKPEGLIKQSFSVTTASGRKLHVISYFTKRDVREGRLRRVSEDPRFVGEGGGEWGLKVDKEEYSFPDGQSRVPGQSEQGADGEDDDGEDSDGLTSPSPQPDSFTPSRKRFLPDELAEETDKPSAKQQRPPLRPIITRKRSSSMSNMASSSENLASVSKSSSYFQSSSASSNVTSVSGDSSTQKNTAAPPKSHLVRALVSPTLPRESAIRGSACDMHPTHSQDSANAVGALLSLAGSKGTAGNPGPSPLRSGGVRCSDSIQVSSAATNDTSSSPGLGLTVKSIPDRRDSDQTALNMFHVRL